MHLPREALLRISLFRPNLDYGDIIFDKPNNKSSKSKIESIQYKTRISTTGVFQGTMGSLYRELGLPFLNNSCFQKHTFFNKMFFFFLIIFLIKGLSPRYLTKYLNLRFTSNYQTRSANKFIKRFIRVFLQN